MPPSQFRPASRPVRTSWAWVLGAVLLVVVAAGSAVLVPWPGRGVADTRASDSGAADSSGSCCQADPAAAALSVLRGWDARRAAAWATGDPVTLRALYTPASLAGERDVAMLLSYRQRGLRVEGMETQVLRVRVVTFRPDLLVLDVVDRLAISEAVGSGSRVALPRGAPTQHRITLVKRDGDWLVSRVVS